MASLIRALMPDGCELDGAFDAPSASPTTSIDGALLIHGTGSNFYGARLLGDLVEPLTSRGIAVLRANTRGHDGINITLTAKGGARLGAAYEVVDDCRHDLAGWTHALHERGAKRIVWIGHSLGAVKSLYASAHGEMQPAGIVAISPPRLSYSWFCESQQSAEFLKSFAQAEALVSSGEPTSLIEVKIPLPMAISAGGYLEKYGPDERYNFQRFLRLVRPESLFTFGEKELHNLAFRDSPAEIRTLAARGKTPITVHTVAGADHVYTGQRQPLVDLLTAWLEATFGTNSAHP